MLIKFESLVVLFQVFIVLFVTNQNQKFPPNDLYNSLATSFYWFKSSWNFLFLKCFEPAGWLHVNEYSGAGWRQSLGKFQFDLSIN